jgi:hypothetical protein
MEGTPENNGRETPKPAPQRPRIAAPTVWLLVLMALVVTFLYLARDSQKRDEIDISLFFAQLKDKNIKEIKTQGPGGLRLNGKFRQPPLKPPPEKTDDKAEEKKDAEPARYREDFFVTLPPWSDRKSSNGRSSKAARSTAPRKRRTAPLRTWSCTCCSRCCCSASCG